MFGYLGFLGKIVATCLTIIVIKITIEALLNN